MNEGLYGGTFNPLHNGHIEVIKYVTKKFRLKRVHLIPCDIPPHKTTRELAPCEYRFEMIQQSVKDIPALEASDIELTRKGLSYTVDTIKEFKRISPVNLKTFFIMGSDAFFDMSSWKKTAEIFHLTSIIIMIRAKESRSVNDIASFIKNVISPEYRFSEKNNIFHHHSMQPVHICRVPEINISSTIIRERIKANLPIDSMVPGPVARLIRKKGLYII